MLVHEWKHVNQQWHYNSWGPVTENHMSQDIYQSNLCNNYT